VEIDPSTAKSTEEENVVKLQLRARAIDNTRFGKTSRGLEGQELEEFQRVYDRVEKNARGSVLSRRTPAGQMVQFHASILEIPQVDSWKFQLLESDWQTVRATLGQFQNEFIPMFATKGPPVLGTAEGGAYVESLQSAVEQYEAAESKLASKYEQAFRDSSAALLKLVASGAKLEGELLTNPFSNDYDEPVTGFFAIVKGNEGTLTIESRKDKAKRLLCHFRLLTPDVMKADASISAPLAAKRTLILSPEHPGDLFYGDFYKWNKFEGYLGLTGNILSGEIGSEATFGTHVKLRFTMPSVGSG